MIQTVPIPQDALVDLIRQRRTTHNFTPTLIDDSVINEALATAVWAPNHKFTQPWRFVLPGEKTQQAICQLNAKLVAASKGERAAQVKLERWQAMPNWLVISQVIANDELIYKEDYAACACLVQNLSLLLWNQGVGLKWSTGDVIRHPEFYELLGINPAEEEVVGLFWYGEPASEPSVKREPAEGFTRRLP